jgi:phosphoribosylformylglycinamidine cyclo-ligase
MSERGIQTRVAYARAGVDIDAGDRAVDLLRTRIGPQSGDLLGGLGGFAAAMPLPTGYREPVLVSATDGVGTKTEIARRLNRYDTIGRDLVAMCADDVVSHGARPVWFLDYLAVGRVDPRRVSEIVGGVADACAEIGCSVIGGETAEHPGLMDAEAFDLAGFCIGLVERDLLIDGSTAREDDVVLGMASSGLHANGFSLVRLLLERELLELDAALLEPTRLYAPAVLRLIETLRVRGLRLSGLAHVTGGGLPGNLPRALPTALGVRLQLGSWPEPDVFDRIARAARMDGAEMRATFNCGIGMAAVVEPNAVDVALELLGDEGIAAWQIGVVRPAAELGARYSEA